MHYLYFSVLLCHYSHEHGSYWRVAGSIGHCMLVLCCLEGEKVVGSNDNSVLASFMANFSWKLCKMRLCSKSDPFYSCI